MSVQEQIRGQGKTIPLRKLIKVLWPDIKLYDKQLDILESLEQNDETYVRAGNMLGKDFIAALGVLAFFLTRYPCRVVTTSVDSTQLNAVLWGEMRRFIQSSAHPLTVEDGGPLIVNDLHIRRVIGDSRGRQSVCGLSYILGRVATNDGTGFLGHHIANTGDGIPRTLFVADEASGVPQGYYEKSKTWAQRFLAIGNPYECSNFFKHAAKGVPGTDDKGGDIRRDDDRDGFFRRVIRIQAQDSPNVRLAEMQIANGMKPTGEVLLPGVKDYDTYRKNRKLWDKISQCISLDGEFYEGADSLLFPPEWLNRANEIARRLMSNHNRQAKTIGCDTAQGGDNTCWAITDELGLMELISKKTPNTAVIPGETIALIKKYKVLPENVLFDQGGGGKEHADRLRAQGYNVRTVAFGEAATPQNVDKFKRNRAYRPTNFKIEEAETKYVYKNRRSEMYGLMRLLIDPASYADEEGNADPYAGFGIPVCYYELRRQLAPIPLIYDEEGRLVLPKKRKKDKEDKAVTLTDIIGCSPDEADALALAVFGLIYQPTHQKLGALI